jgi:hypothetical protein
MILDILSLKVHQNLGTWTFNVTWRRAPGLAHFGLTGLSVQLSVVDLSWLLRCMSPGLPHRIYTSVNCSIHSFKTHSIYPFFPTTLALLYPCSEEERIRLVMFLPLAGQVWWAQCFVFQLFAWAPTGTSVSFTHIPALMMLLTPTIFLNAKNLRDRECLICVPHR